MNHSQGDRDLAAHFNLGRCRNVLNYDEDGNEVICGDECSPADQMCQWCLRNALADDY